MKLHRLDNDGKVCSRSKAKMPLDGAPCERLHGGQRPAIFHEFIPCHTLAVRQRMTVGCDHRNTILIEDVSDQILAKFSHVKMCQRQVTSPPHEIRDKAISKIAVQAHSETRH